jgi:hypothetical protein
LRDAAEEQKNQCMANRWNIPRKNKEPIILRDLIDKILVWVEKFSQIGNCVAQYDPVHAALPWAGIRLILQVDTEASHCLRPTSANEYLDSHK